jgi:hypothetical protein
MNLSDLKMVLSKIGVATENLQPSSPNQLLIPCPLAKWLHKADTDQDTHPSCSIRFGDPDRSTLYNCFSCKSQGKLWDLVHTVGSLSNDSDLTLFGLKLAETDEPSLSARLESISSSFDDWVHERKGTSLIVLQEEVLENFAVVRVCDLARTYLPDRGISMSVAEEWDLRYCFKQKRIVFPVRDANSRLVGAVGRAIFSDTRPKYYNYFGFETGSTLGGLHRLTGQPRIGVCEGFFDAIRHWRLAQEHGFDFVCTFTSKTSKQQAELLLSRDANIYYFYDQDEAGESGWDLAKKRLGKLSYGLRRVVWADKTLDVGGSNTLQFKDILNGIVSTVETTTGTK